MGNTPCQHPDGCCPAKNKTNEDSLTNNSSRLTVPRIYKLPLVETTYAQLISQSSLTLMQNQLKVLSMTRVKTMCPSE